MLVLSRGKNDKVVFPALGISVEILRVAGNKVRLGIDAPKDVTVHRHEVAARNGSSEKEAVANDESTRKRLHTIKNRLQTASLGLHVLQRKLELGKAVEADIDIFKILNELKALEGELQDSSLEKDTPAKSAAPAKTEGHRALIVEDDDNERELLSGYLQMSGFQVDTAADGLQAMVRLTQEQRPDVVLLDMRMPRFDGEKTISAIRCNPSYRGLKVFAVSGTPMNETNVSVNENGVDRWFSKPLDPRDLVSAINEDLRREECAPV